MKLFPIQLLEVYGNGLNKRRYGKDNDGGYIILDKLKYDLFISCGIGNDDSFEVDFVNTNYIECIAFDGTIKEMPTKHPKIKWIDKNIGRNEANGRTCLFNIIEPKKDILLKMDIEFAEYNWIDILNTHMLNKFKQMVIEFHFPFDEGKWKQIKKINETHLLIHIHPNNYGGVRIIDNVVIPNCFEATFVRKSVIEKTYNKDPFPTSIDMPNNPSIPEIELMGYPYNK